MSWSNASSWPRYSSRRAWGGAVKPVTVVLGLGLFLAACGAEGSVTSDNEGSSSPQNEDSEARFPANQQIGPMNLHVPEEWEPFDVESSDRGEIAGAEVAWSADLTWPGERGEVTARYWIAHHEESGALAAVEYGGYGADEDELDAYQETLELVP